MQFRNGSCCAVMIQADGTSLSKLTTATCKCSQKYAYEHSLIGLYVSVPQPTP